jgi:hypothetical protein
MQFLIVLEQVTVIVPEVNLEEIVQICVSSHGSVAVDSYILGC